MGTFQDEVVLCQSVAMPMPIEGLKPNNESFRNEECMSLITRGIKAKVKSLKNSALI